MKLPTARAARLAPSGRAVAFGAALLLVAPIVASRAAFGHGGEDHGGGAPRAGEIRKREHVSSGETELFSVVVKYPARKAEAVLPMRVYVARAETSAPVSGAAIHVELKGGVAAEAEARPSDDPGVYDLQIPSPPDGSRASGVVSVQAKDDFDLVVVGELEFGPVAAPVAAPEEHHRELPAWPILAAGALAVFAAGGIGFSIGRGRRPRARPIELRADLPVEADTSTEQAP